MSFKAGAIMAPDLKYVNEIWGMLSFSYRCSSVTNLKQMCSKQTLEFSFKFPRFKKGGEMTNWFLFFCLEWHFKLYTSGENLPEHFLT